MQKGSLEAENFFQDMKGKSILITGSTKGIGLEIARIMLASGANVVVNSRSQKDVETTVRKLEEDPKTRGAVKGMHGDVGSFEECQRLADFTMQCFG
ncbi:MAG TPA: SDR family oxidoreductase, partial [Nitrososphaerales archaeon]|nr:SDR family oxidoreductase [Nitrososphaerales archaeon]